jgi:segregation and condensation protein B
MDQNEKKVEAVLFAVGKEISAERIASLCALNVKEVKQTVEKLTKYHQGQDNSLKIEKKENGWKLTVNDEFLPLVSTIVSHMELETPLMETLAVIAWKYPIIQSEIIKLRGSGAYEHMKLLSEQGFIAKEKFGRTYKVKLTQKFFNYFDLPSEEAKKAFLNQVPSEVLKEAENVEKEADEIERLIEIDNREKSAKGEIDQAMKEVHE